MHKTTARARISRTVLMVCMVGAVATVIGLVTRLIAAPSAALDHAGTPDLGLGASLHGKAVFPADNPWNTDISKEPVDPSSDAIIKSIGASKALHSDFGTTYNNAPSGIPYFVVAGNAPKVPITFAAYGNESDPGPYPIPPGMVVEGGNKSDGDRHILVLDRDNWILYEMYRSFEGKSGPGWTCDSGAIFDLKVNKDRPAGWTSADAAGLPIFPGLVRYDEAVEGKAINHALRFTVQKSRKAYVAPARHWASSRTDASLPPMGMRVRLKASFDISKYSAEDQVILTALKKYGMILADNGSDWFVSGAPDSRWNDDNLHALSKVKGHDFEVVKMGTIVTK